MPSTFIPNAAFLRSEAVRHYVSPIGAAVVDEARREAPHRLGYLADSIEGHWTEDGGRLVFRVAAHDFKARWLEFGTVNMEAEPFLGPAALAIVGNLK